MFALSYERQEVWVQGFRVKGALASGFRIRGNAPARYPYYPYTPEQIQAGTRRANLLQEFGAIPCYG